MRMFDGMIGRTLFWLLLAVAVTATWCPDRTIGGRRWPAGARPRHGRRWAL